MRIFVLSLLVAAYAFWASGAVASAVAEPCGTGSAPSGQTLKGAKDAQLKVAPGPSGAKMLNEKATAALGAKHYLSIDNSVTVTEECTKGGWSRIRVTQPDWLKDTHIGWVPSSALRGKKLDAAGTEVFTEADFVWDKLTRPHKEVIVAGVNKIRRENARCKDVDPATASVSSSKGTKADPVFFVTCGSGNQAFNVFFSKSDVQGGKVLAAARNLPKGKAVELCEQHVRSKAQHPSTVKFGGSSFMEHPNGRTTVITTFTAKNSFNLGLKHDVKCLLDASGVMEATIAESRN